MKDASIALFIARAGAEGRMAAAGRMAGVGYFEVMNVMARAAALEAAGRRVLHLEVGQPQSSAPAAALAAAQGALATQRLGYTDARGIPAVREAISELYRTRYNAVVDPACVHVTTGSSAAFTLAFMAAFDAGDAVGMPSVSYPCYRNVLSALGCEAVAIEGKASPWALDATDVDRTVAARRAAGLPPLRGVVVSSPSNPTGVMLGREAVATLATTCAAHGIRLISDEIYQGLAYGAAGGGECVTAWRFGEAPGPAPIVVNSFSKYYSMTGWRVGWLLAPPDVDDAVHRLHQNLYICAPAVAQVAALGALSDEAAPELDAHVARYARNRLAVLSALEDMGVSPHRVAPADGAFYVYVDLGAALADAGGDAAAFDSPAACAALLDAEGVAVTPGTDFERTERGRRRLRISYAGAEADVAEAMERMGRWWRADVAAAGGVQV